MAVNPAVLEVEHWDAQYRARRLPWDTGRPSTELRRVLKEQAIQPGRAVELGCGTGASAVWLAQWGFDVTGIDLSPSAILRARQRAARARVRVHFRAADLTAPGVLRSPYNFFFDGG